MLYLNSAIWVMLGGALGALARWGVEVAFLRVSLARLPLGTWTVNVLGCFLAGLCLAFLLTKPSSEPMRLFMMVGFLGSFTTFSAFSLQALELYKSSPNIALGYVASSVLLGLGASMVGISLGRWMLS